MYVCLSVGSVTVVHMYCQRCPHMDEYRSDASTHEYTIVIGHACDKSPENDGPGLASYKSQLRLGKHRLETC